MNTMPSYMLQSQPGSGHLTSKYGKSPAGSDMRAHENTSNNMRMSQGSFRGLKARKTME